MMVRYQAPFEIPLEPSRTDGTAYHIPKRSVWDLVLKLDSTGNTRIHTFDQKNHTSKVSSLRKRWRQLRSSNPDAYRSLAAQFLALKSSGSVVDDCTSETHLWTAVDLA
ncbi:hypothetical protein PC128_g24699 [Phytophthora cactorum]|nr:hypothetical protein PC128_g24699 [Phytophthora cactorum]